MLDHPEIERFGRIADLLARKGWAEANAGNFSTRIDPGSFISLPDIKDTHALRHPFPDLEGAFFLVTATRSRARDISSSIESNVGLLEIGKRGEQIYNRWGSIPATSEFPAHLSIYSACLDKRPEIRSVLHTHPPHLIAMSHLQDIDISKMNRTLKMMHPEVGILVPDGVALVEYEIPGSLELGKATAHALLNRNVVIWQMHGIVSIAEDLDKALDQVEIVEKAAQIYLLVRSTGQEPRGLTPEQVKESREYWGIKGDKE